MAVRVVGLLLLLLSMAALSEGNYCVCNGGMGDGVLQNNIDYACGNGADCSPIQQNGPCFNPNTVRDHCNYAVNSFFQRKGQVAGSCDFQGSTAVTPNPPNASAAAGCVYPSSSSNVGTSSTLPGNPVGGTPMTTGPANQGSLPGSSMTPPGLGMGPTPITGTGPGFSNPDSSGGLEQSRDYGLFVLPFFLVIFNSVRG